MLRYLFLVLCFVFAMINIWVSNAVQCRCAPPHCGQGPRRCRCGWLVRMAEQARHAWHRMYDAALALWERYNPRCKPPAAPDADRLRVAYVSVYNTSCGIATYNEALVPELRQHVDLHVFAEYADEKMEQRLESDPEWVTRCWDRYIHPKRELIDAIRRFNPDIVHIGHEYGLFPRAYQFTSLVSSLKMRGYKVVATMHSIYDHSDKTVQEAAGQHIIAHTASGRDLLVQKGIAEEKITVIPHGSTIYAGTESKPELLPELFNTWHTPYTLFQPGFLFEYKGHMRMLDVVARLKQKYPEVHYIVQASENPRNQAEHDLLYEKLSTRIAELGIEENVTISRGFVEMSVLMSYIRTAKTVVLPYANAEEHDVRATSGIARLVMATGTPLVVSNVHLFDDLEGLAPRVANDEELYNAIDLIWTDWKQKVRQRKARLQFLKDTSWSAVACAHKSLYKKL